MTDHGMAKAVLANASGVKSVIYFDAQRNKLPRRKTGFDHALITFHDGERFEVSEQTLKLIPAEKIKVTKGNSSAPSSKIQQRLLQQKADQSKPAPNGNAKGRFTVQVDPKIRKPGQPIRSISDGRVVSNGTRQKA